MMPFILYLYNSMVLPKKILLSILIIFHVAIAQGQIVLIRHADKDTAYIREYYRKHLVLRAYESTKFNNFKFIEGPDKLIFKPNDHNVFGIGFNYRFISFNFGIYVPATGKSLNTYGRTKRLDLQPHLYVHRFLIDIYAQFYHGYYLSNADAIQNSPPNDNVEKRPDITSRNLSLEIQYLFNDKRFSYNAPFYQNERQKKSAGSFLLGGGIYSTDIHGDSALTPANISYGNFFNNYHFTDCHNTGIGVNGGYAYTLVIKKYFFLTEAITGGAGINHASLSTPSSQIDRTGAGLSLTAKFAAGYNSDNYFAGIYYTRLITEDNSLSANTWQEVNTGNFRFTIAKRIHLRKALIPKSDLIKIE